MIHYSCDRCKRPIDTDDELRYVVRLEVHAAMEPLEVDAVEDDRDHLLEVQEILERLEDVDSEALGDELYQRCRYDLCSDCYREFMKNPVGSEARAHFGFSQN